MSFQAKHTTLLVLIVLAAGITILTTKEVCAQGLSTCFLKSYVHAQEIRGSTIVISQTNTIPAMHAMAQQSCLDAVYAHSKKDGIACSKACEGDIADPTEKVCKATAIHLDQPITSCTLDCNQANTACSAYRNHRFICKCEPVGG